MDTISPLTVPSDSWKSLVCKICKKDDVVLNLKTCGCFFCDSCDGDSQNICVSCRSKVNPRIKLSFSKKPRCKYHELNQCFNNAEYKCNCIPDCLVCDSCLSFIHDKRVRGSCVPEILTPKVTTNYEPCQMCEEFIAEFKMTSEPYSKFCFDCKTKSNAICIPFEKDSDQDSDWSQFYKEYVQCSRMILGKIKKIEKALELTSLDREQRIQKCKDALSQIQKCLIENTEQSDRQIAALEQQLDNFKKISNILKPNGTMKTILDLLKNKQLNLHGKNGKKEIWSFLNFYREKNYYNPRYPRAEKIKTLYVRNYSRKQYLLKFPLPSNSSVSSNSGVPAKSDVSVQEIIDNGVKPFVVLVEKPSTVNERKKILEDIQKHEDKWVRKERFDVFDIVIIFDADATDSPKYKRAKILNRKKDVSKVFLLDFGFKTTVKNSSIGEINEITINGKKTCFLAQLTGSVNVNCDFKQKDGLPKAQHLVTSVRCKSNS
ncbi:uncharacterized protein LOC107360780 [Tetranychus urticae]|uniref:Uncharacterized protein n=1 Tax=Tetranychus urticae TaxID=32264 RepID=T1K5H7_TETUR|nr:uncharacterized protein LOC107360780 [Tetranychus urticae]